MKNKIQIKWVPYRSLIHFFRQMALCVALSLIICWTPYTLIAMWQSFGNADLLPVRLEAAAAILAKSSTAITPLTHLWFVQKYQLFFRSLCCCQKWAKAEILENSQDQSSSLVSCSGEQQPAFGNLDRLSVFSTERLPWKSTGFADEDSSENRIRFIRGLGPNIFGSSGRLITRV